VNDVLLTETDSPNRLKSIVAGQL